MADIPVPRSYEQIVSDIVDAFIARTGISALKVGSPLRSMMEAVAQSQFRGSQDTFNLLEAASLDHATGDALTQIAADEGLVRKNASASFGYVTFTDKAFTKISSQLVYQTAAGQTSITLLDATGFTGGAVIIDGEEYAISTIAGNTITLGSALVKTLAQGTEVVFKQGNPSTIPAGTSVGTGTTNFTTVNSVTIPAGEVSVSNVAVVCATEGTSGNVTALSINVINSTVAGLTNPTVSNPLPFINGQDQETDDQLRDRVRYAKYNKQKATPAAVQNAVIGVQSPTDSGESKKVISASIYDVGEGKASLYIDDGTGYEPITSSIGIETLTASATGGEKYFELQGGRPVAKCFIESETTFPHKMTTDATLVVVTGIGGTAVTDTLAIPVSAFVDATNAGATSYELVSFINSQTGLSFSAATRDNHTKVVLYPKSDDVNTITVTSDNEFAFPLDYPVSTLYLFRDGILQVEGVDYTLNRFKGQIYLDTELARGESLVVGSVDIRTSTKVNVPSSNSTYSSYEYLWFGVDDSVERVFDKGSLFISKTLNSVDSLVTFHCFAGFNGAQSGDWVIAWSSATNSYWTKRIESATYQDIVVRGDSLLGIISGFGVFRFSNPDTVPQKLNVPQYTSVNQLVTLLNSAPYNSLSGGLHVEQVGTSDSIRFVTNSFQTTGAMYFLTGTSTVVQDFHLQWSSTTNTNPSSYQTSLVSNSEIEVSDASGQTIIWPNNLDIGKISKFVTGQQEGFRTTQYNSTSFRNQLDDSISTLGTSSETVLYETVDTYSGFHLSDTDKLSVKLDGDATQTYTFPMSIDAKITSTSLTDPNNVALPFASKYPLKDWAIWSATSQTATLSTDGDSVTFTSKLYGPSNPIETVEIAYPQNAEQTSFSYSISDSGKFSVLLKSGTSITPDFMDSTQVFWLGNYDNTNKTMDMVCRFDGVGYHGGVPSKTTLDVYVVDGYSMGFYPQITLALQNDMWVCVYDATGTTLIGNLRVIGVDPVTNPNLVTFTLEDPDPVMPTVSTNVKFSISRNQSASQLASFDGMPTGCLVNNSDYKTTFKLYSSGLFDEITFSCGSDISYQTGAWKGDNVTFFNRVLNQPLVLENDYFTITPTNVLVTESTEDTYDFNIPSGVGVVPKTGRVNYVKESDSTTIQPKKTQSYADLVRLVPITAQNVADHISFLLSSNGVVSASNSVGEVEICRQESGALSSVEVTGGSANKQESVSAVLDSSGDFCSVAKESASSFVEGFWVSITDGVSSASVRIEKVVAGENDTNRYVYFLSTVADPELYDPQKTTITALNKLGFPENTPATNSDGYKYYSGLLGEVNKVVYGDPADPVNYPGYASANANIEVTAPQVKRIPLDIYVRMQNGFTLSGATLAIRNAAATAVNSTPVGQDVAYSDIISAINAISGVFSVAIAGHTETNPTIPVLAYEKPLVVNLEGDINVTITGI
jgi:uncharacterized phage protein gp47/JayE